ncbi:5-oxoprolinase subunit PxpA [Microbulbifer sp. SA54]|uniref:5-oxoprolinase subunit PxpA n=1 Tax=Microbulbifer sp. SA54 TaxID=3401577 RepID=UPI003AB0DC3C
MTKTAMHSVDINCDLGEGRTRADCQRDARLMPFISRCNIACGGHAGSATTMALSLENAALHNLAIGAHPSYPDREHFGRASMSLETDQLLQSLCEQVHSLKHIADARTLALDHVKLHGALYNDAEADDALAEKIVGLFAREFPELRILGLANGAMERAARKIGQPVIREGFMDRRYLSAHQLAPRNMPGAVINSFDACLQQVISLCAGTPFPSIHGDPLQITADSICLHGDNTDAEKIARDLAAALSRAGYEIKR